MVDRVVDILSINQTNEQNADFRSKKINDSKQCGQHAEITQPTSN